MGRRGPRGHLYSYKDRTRVFEANAAALVKLAE
jgi:hypothetical protein